MKTTFLVVGGTFESYPDDRRTQVPDGAMCHRVTRKLDPKYFSEAIWVGYPADYGSKGMSYAESRRVGVRNTVETALRVARQTTDSIALMGYSQGAAVVAEVLVMVDQGKIPELLGRVLGGANIASPVRRRDAATVAGAPVVPGYGVAGEMARLNNLWLFELAAVGDPITALPIGSLLRDVADLSDYMNPSDLIDWFADVLHDILLGQTQNARINQDLPARLRAWVEVSADMRRYLPFDPKTNPTGGRHTRYGIEKVRGQDTYCDVLAGALNWKAKKLAGVV